MTDVRLPPRPDPETGEPFPPHGLVFAGKGVEPERDPDRETRLSKKPARPDGCGRVLVWYRENTLGKAKLALWGMGFFVVAITIMRAIEGDENPLDWMRFWWVWAFFGVVTFLIVGPTKAWTYSAGADWFNVRVTRFGHIITDVTISLYDIRKIHSDMRGVSWFLDIYDSRDSLSLTIPQYQKDRRIWDLVYNGMVHSVVNGAKISKTAFAVLEIDDAIESYTVEDTEDLDTWSIDNEADNG